MSTNPLQPKWVGVRGTSKLEGSHPYYHASLPGSSYAPATASSILDCRLGQMNVQAAARQGRTTAASLSDAFEQERKKAILGDEGWGGYQLPAAVSVPASTTEKFGFNYCSSMDALAAAKAQQQQYKEEFWQPLSDEEENEVYSAVNIGDGGGDGDDDGDDSTILLGPAGDRIAKHSVCCYTKSHLGIRASLCCHACCECFWPVLSLVSWACCLVPCLQQHLLLCKEVFTIKYESSKICLASVVLSCCPRHMV